MKVKHWIECCIALMTWKGHAFHSPLGPITMHLQLLMEVVPPDKTE